MSRSARLGAIALTACLLTGCRAQPEQETLLVFAAASLTDVMHDLEARFEAQYPELDVVVSAGASSMLARQIEQGAPADVFLSASPVWVDDLVERGHLRSAQPLIGNRLVVVGSAEAAPLRSLDGLRRFEHIALADPAHVPAGQYARQGLERAGLWSDLAGRVIPALDVRAVVAAVQTGAVPAGIVYASDARVVSGVRVLLDWPEQVAPDVRYSAAIPANATHPAYAEAFIAFGRDGAQDAVWQRYGFRLLDEAGS